VTRGAANCGVPRQWVEIPRLVRTCPSVRISEPDGMADFMQGGATMRARAARDTDGNSAA
jgi:hypothetical protein